MDALGDFLDKLKQHGGVEGNFLGLLHVLVGRRVDKADGTPVCDGLTWRALAAALKKARWKKDAVRELGLNPRQLPPRHRERFWYAAISRAQLDSAAATGAGNRLAETLRSAGYVVGPAPGQPPPT